MTSRNEVTGKMIVVGAEPDSKLYDEGWDRIFGKKKAPPDTPQQEAFKEKLMEKMFCNACKGSQWKEQFVNGQWDRVLCPYCTGVAYTGTICDVCTRVGCTECQREVE